MKYTRGQYKTAENDIVQLNTENITESIFNRW